MSEQEKKYSFEDNCHGLYVLFKRPDGTTFHTRSEFIDELNALLARAEKAEGDLKTIISNQNNFLKQMYIAFDTAAAEIYHPDIGAAERKPMKPHERIEWLGKSRDEWKARAEKAEAERDELMRKLSEARVKEHWEANEVERQLLRRAEAVEAKLKLQSGLCNTLPVVTNDPIDWNRVRIDAAIAAMHGCLATREPVDKDDERELASCSTRCADLLVAELKKEAAE